MTFTWKFFDTSSPNFLDISISPAGHFLYHSPFTPSLSPPFIVQTIHQSHFPPFYWI